MDFVQFFFQRAARVGQERYKKGKYIEAADLFDRITTSDQFAEFLTLPGYERLD